MSKDTAWGILALILGGSMSASSYWINTAEYWLGTTIFMAVHLFWLFFFEKRNNRNDLPDKVDTLRKKVTQPFYSRKFDRCF